MSDYDDGGQLDPGYTGNDQPDVFGGHDVELGHFESGQDHSALDQLHEGHGAESDQGQHFNVFEHDHGQAETTELEHGQHAEYSAGYDEGEQPSFTGGDVDDLHDRLSGLGGEHGGAQAGGSAHLGVASN